MKIYIASSWKNEEQTKGLAAFLRRDGFEVDCFCDPSLGRFVFTWQELGIAPERLMTSCDTVALPQFEKAYCEDRKWLDWADCVVMLLPCGKSSHLEAGYAKGARKHLVFYGGFAPGEWEVMYGFADALVGDYSYSKLVPGAARAACRAGGEVVMSVAP